GKMVEQQPCTFRLCHNRIQGVSTMQAKINAKAKAEKMLRRAYDCRHKLKDYTSEAISERHGVSTHTVGNMRNGRDPKYVPNDVKRAIRLDFMRYQELAEGYFSLDQIALEVGVSRSLVRKWAKELGLTMAMPHKAQVKPVPKRREWE